MYDMIAIGDTTQDIFLEMSSENAHIHAEKRNEFAQICFNYADKIPVSAMHDLVGGNSSNAAVGFARLGFKTGVYTHIGDDDQGERIRRDYKENNVSDEYIVVDKGLSTNYSVVINTHGERTILIYHVHRPYKVPHMQAAKWAYLSSMGEGFEIMLPGLIDYVKEHKVNLCYQPGTFQLKYGAEKSAELIKNTKIFMVNKEEAELYLGIKSTSNFREHLDGILALGAEIALVTDGTEGAYVSDGREYLYLGIIKEAPRLEATGAGDAFSTAFTAALADGQPLREALRWGQIQSSSVIQHVGPHPGLLYKKQMEQMLEHYQDLQPVEINANGRPAKDANIQVDETVFKPEPTN